MLRGGLVVFLITLGGIAPLIAQPFSSPDNGRLQNSYGEVRGKPWLERIVPGATFQIQRQNRGGLDLNLFSGYRFTERLTSGLGWNERVSVHFRHHFGLGHRRRVYGPRSFVDYKLARGFSVRIEIEIMNTFVPPLQGVSPPGAVGSRQWIWGVLFGVKKNIRLTDWFRANAQLLYNLHDDVYKTSPYSDRLNFRFGVEFSFRKRTKPRPQ